MFDDKNLECTSGVAIFKVLKTDKIASLKQEIVEHFKLQNEKFRLWMIMPRSNKTVRVDQPLTATDEKQSKCASFLNRVQEFSDSVFKQGFEKLRAQTCATNHPNGFAKLYLETADAAQTKFPNVKSDTSLVFLKYFDIKEQKIR